MVGAFLKSFADGAQVIILTSHSWADVQQPQPSILMIYVTRFAEVWFVRSSMTESHGLQHLGEGETS